MLRACPEMSKPNPGCSSSSRRRGRVHGPRLCHGRGCSSAAIVRVESPSVSSIPSPLLLYSCRMLRKDLLDLCV